MNETLRYLIIFLYSEMKNFEPNNDEMVERIERSLEIEEELGSDLGNLPGNKREERRQKEKKYSPDSGTLGSQAQRMKDNRFYQGSQPKKKIKIEIKGK